MPTNKTKKIEAIIIIKRKTFKRIFFELQIKCPLTVRRGNLGPHHIQHSFLCKTLLQWTWAGRTEDTEQLITHASIAGYFTCLSPVVSAQVFMSLPVADTLRWWDKISFFHLFLQIRQLLLVSEIVLPPPPSDWFYCSSRSLLFFLPPDSITSLPYISPTNTSLSFSLALLLFSSSSLMRVTAVSHWSEGLLY